MGQLFGDSVLTSPHKGFLWEKITIRPQLVSTHLSIPVALTPGYTFEELIA